MDYKKNGRDVPLKLGQMEIGKAIVYPDGTFDAIVIDTPHFLGSIQVGQGDVSIGRASVTDCAVGGSVVQISGSTGRPNVMITNSSDVQIGNNNVQVNIAQKMLRQRKLPWQM